MKLIVISPEGEDAREPAVLTQLLAAGLAGYHLRKPGWGRDAMAAFLRAVPEEFHSRMVLHTHHDLANEFAVGGVHERDQPKADASSSAPRQGQLSVDVPVFPRRHSGLLRSRAVHDLEALRLALAHYDRVLFSPVFPSLSKPGRTPDPRVTPADIRAVLAFPRGAEAIALGGIDASRLAACRELGFDGVAVLGAVWQAADPVRACAELQRSLFAHAACSIISLRSWP